MTEEPYHIRYYRTHKDKYKTPTKTHSLMCEECHKPFSHYRRNVRFCNECRLIRCRRKTKELQHAKTVTARAERSKKCEECGTVFQCKSLKKKRCPSCDIAARKQRAKVASTKYSAKHRTRLRKEYHRYVTENKEHCLEKWRDYHHKTKDNPQKIVAARCRNRIRRFMKHKHCKSEELCGCSWAELVTHIENQFSDNMSWENYGDWHIDHIKPCAAFDLTDKNQVSECFHFSNLQPLWKQDNLSKSSIWRGCRRYYSKP